jgi:hypothetical protein
MRELELTVRELLAAAQRERKAKLDAGRVDTVFKVGDQVLLRTKELLDAADIGKLRPRWDGPFMVTDCPGPNAYTLALPRRMRCSPIVNVDRLKPFHARLDDPPAPGPVADLGQEGEHEVELLLNRKEVRGVPHYLVRWRGHSSAADEWLRAEALANCPEKVAEYEAAAPRRRAARRAQAAALPPPPVPRPSAVPAPLQAPDGFRLASAAERRGGAGLVGARVLYLWPGEGWVQGRVRGMCRRSGFSHVVGYASSSPLGRVVVDTLLDEASHGVAGRWQLLLPATRDLRARIACARRVRAAAVCGECVR